MNEVIVQPGQLYEIAPDGKWCMFFDASMLKTFLDCEQMFEYKYIKHLRLRGAVNWKSELGSWWSSTMQYYYNAFRQGDLNKELVAEVALQAWSDRKMSLFEPAVPKSYADFGGEAAAVLMALRYYDETHVYDESHWQVLAVEEGAGRKRELLVGETTKVRVYYITLPDLFVLVDKVALAPVDHKSKDYIDTRLQHAFKPHLQTCGYIWAARFFAAQLGLNVVTNHCVINVAARNEPGPKSKNDQRFKRIPVHYSPEQLDHWALRVLKAGERMRECIETNFFQWNDESCHKYSGCTYRPIDAAPSDARLQVIKSSYAEKEPWVQYTPDEEED
jgi:hypothetical protein